jgi:hypothetical protein
MKTRSHEVSPSRIAADVDVGASVATDRSGGMCEEQELSASTLDSTCASVAAAVSPISQDSRACIAPPATFESSRTLSCDRDEANRTEMR